MAFPGRILAPSKGDCYIRTTLGQQYVREGSIWWRVQKSPRRIRSLTQFSPTRSTSLKFFDEEILYEEGPTSGGGGDRTASHRRGPRCSGTWRLHRRRRRPELDVQYHRSRPERRAADWLGAGRQDRL